MSNRLNDNDLPLDNLDVDDIFFGLNDNDNDDEDKDEDEDNEEDDYEDDT